MYYSCGKAESQRGRNVFTCTQGVPSDMLSRSIWALVTFMMVSGCSKYYQGEDSDHFNGTHFFNPGKPLDKGLGTFLKWRLTADKQPWPEYTHPPAYDTPPARVDGKDLRVSYVGHATVLIQTRGLNILTDPVLSDRASPVQWAGPRRVHPPGIKMENLPDIDVILISHNHYDHLDLPALQKLWQRNRPRIIVPLGNDIIITGYDASIEVEARDWGEEVQLAEGVAVHLDPMQHWSARGLFDRNRALWAAFIISSPDGNIYFAGDTGYGNGDYFRAAREKYRSFRLAILPIGAYEPRWFMAYGHMNPEECVRSFEDLGGPMVLPIHHRVFQLADTGYHQPLEMLEAALDGNKKAQARFLTLMVGEGRYIP